MPKKKERLPVRRRQAPVVLELARKLDKNPGLRQVLLRALKP